MKDHESLPRALRAIAAAEIIRHDPTRLRVCCHTDQTAELPPEVVGKAIGDLRLVEADRQETSGM